MPHETALQAILRMLEAHRGGASDDGLRAFERALRDEAARGQLRKALVRWFTSSQGQHQPEGPLGGTKKGDLLRWDTWGLPTVRSDLADPACNGRILVGTPRRPLLDFVLDRLKPAAAVRLLRFTTHGPKV